MPRWLVLVGVGCAAQDAASGPTPLPEDSGAAATDTDTTPAPEPCPILPADDPWNTDVSAADVHPDSDAFVDAIGRDDAIVVEAGVDDGGAALGIPYVVVPATQPKVPVTFLYSDESDAGPYAIPPEAQVEGGPDGDGDRPVIAVDLDDCVLYELVEAWPVDFGESWRAESGAIFDLRSSALRPDGWASADSSGLPIYPGLLRFDEVEAGEIRHALRVEVGDSQAGFVHPATDAATTHLDPSLPPMGLRLRMKADTDCTGFSATGQVVCAALKTYGMFVADDGPDWSLSLAPDSRWDLAGLAELEDVTGDAFEAVYTGEILSPP
jgi:hypothetical protein